jgi:hypothetical protein
MRASYLNEHNFELLPFRLWTNKETIGKSWECLLLFGPESFA